MTTSPPPAAPKPTRKEVAVAVTATAVRLFLGFWVIFGILQLVPEDADGRFALPLLVAVAATALYIWFFRRQVRLVAQARFPTLRAVEALILVAAMFLALFSMIYVMVSLNDPPAFTEPLDPFTGYYFSLTVLATVGFGDITPVTTLARSITMVQMALDLAFIAVVIRVFTTSARRALIARGEATGTLTDSEV
ncbi:MAG: potassium channel family protein [Candidatus Nanopelagicales bacterium]